MSPQRAARACNTPHCPHLKPCPVHGDHEADNAYNRQRRDTAFYGSVRWQKLRRIIRQREPLCCYHLACGIPVPTGMVEHILRRDTRPDLAWDLGNLGGLCAGCANRKSALEAGGAARAAELQEMITLIRQGKAKQEEPWEGERWRPMVG